MSHRLVVFLDRQHAGKPYEPQDRGAQGQEAYYSARYALYAEQWLTRMGHHVFLLSDGTYSQRGDRAEAYCAPYDHSVYIACHVNAGGGSYGAVFYDYRSGHGPTLASHIGHKLGGAFTELSGVRVMAAREGSRPFNTISAVGTPVSICFEPCFIDHPLHFTDMLSDSGLAAIGQALAEGIDNYWRSHGT